MARGEKSLGTSISSEQRRLDSWKEIAAYLRRDERTVQRWERESGLPVHRTPSGKRGSVFAYGHELDAWLAGQPNGHTEASALPEPVAQAQSLSRAARLGLIIGLAVLALLAMAAWLLLAHGESPRPVRITATTDSIVAWDDAGRRIWEHRYPRGVYLPPSNDESLAPAALSRILDVDGDGESEVLVVVHEASQPPAGPASPELDCFSADGTLRWRYIPEVKFRFGGREFADTRVIHAFAIANPGPAATIWVAVDHNPWWPSAVVQLDARTGRGTVRFFNSGSVYAMGVAGNGDNYRVLAGTFNNEYDRGALAVLDPAQPLAASPQSPASAYHCDDCGDGGPEAYYLFPRSEINQVSRVPINQVEAVVSRGGYIQLEVDELGPDGIGLQYYLALPQGTPTGFAFEDGYWREHRRLEADGKINHKAEDCPDRHTARRVRVWTPQRGWSEVLVPPAPEAL